MVQVNQMDSLDSVSTDGVIVGAGLGQCGYRCWVSVDVGVC